MSGRSGVAWRHLRSFSLSSGSYMVARRCFGVVFADSKKPLILVENQRLRHWMRGRASTDGMQSLPFQFKDSLHGYLFIE